MIGIEGFFIFFIIYMINILFRSIKGICIAIFLLLFINIYIEYIIMFITRIMIYLFLLTIF